MIFDKAMKKKSNQKLQDKKTAIYRYFIRSEAKIGGTLFGPIPEGTRREFFCLDRHTWIWHEEWKDKNGKPQVKTTRYDVRPDGVLKAQSGQQYQRLSYQEISNFHAATQAYGERVMRELYAKAA